MYSFEADIEVIDEKVEKGKNKLTIHKDNLKKEGKKEQSIMISKKSKNDAEVVGLVSDKVVMFLLEGLINKHITEDQVEFQQLVKPLAIRKFKCQQC